MRAAREETRRVLHFDGASIQQDRVEARCIDYVLLWLVVRDKEGQDTATSAVFPQGSASSERVSMTCARLSFARDHVHSRRCLPAADPKKAEKSCVTAFFVTSSLTRTFVEALPLAGAAFSSRSMLVSVVLLDCAPRRALRRLFLCRLPHWPTSSTSTS